MPMRIRTPGPLWRRLVGSTVLATIAVSCVQHEGGESGVRTRDSLERQIGSPQPKPTDQPVDKLSGILGRGGQCSVATTTEKLVANLVLYLDSADPQVVQLSADSLGALGPEALPAIVCRLDDRRLMRSRSVLRLNKGEHFELYRSQKPKRVVDCLLLVIGMPKTGAGKGACFFNDDGTAPDECLLAWSTSGFKVADAYPPTSVPR